MNTQVEKAIHLSISPMKHVLWVCLLLQVLWGCDYARMKDDEALRTYETSIPAMPRKAIPVAGGIEQLRLANPKDLHNPLPFTPETVERGKERYGFYCVQCHGPKADGNGTVGQSFSPLPTDLRGTFVQEQSDGELFYRISLGYKRQPPLAATVSEEERWAIIQYIRSIADRPKG